MGGELVAATSSCVAVGTLAEPDGLTRITLSDEETPTDLETVFDGSLETPTRTLAVCSVLDEVILETAVEHKQTRTRILVDHRAEPGNVWIVVPSTSKRLAR